MLIINADDYGRNVLGTDRSIACFREGRITSASGMVFMADSLRSAEIALEYGLDVGLHLNFTERFSGDVKSGPLMSYQDDIAKFLLKHRYSYMMYNPLLKRSFEYVAKTQFEEYTRLYNRVPSHIDGHQHMHLCTNVLVENIVPLGSWVRRKFTPLPGDKRKINILYRFLVNCWIKRKYKLVDHFYKFPQTGNLQILATRIELAKQDSVEIMVHPEIEDEVKLLRSDGYLRIIGRVPKGTFRDL
jgi:predicted glycoside hydrolase/deacetylase ChbG (UPF0249 family)